MDWCAFTAPFHLYNVLKRCSLLSVALSIASPLLGVTQHPALRSPDFPHPDGNTTIETRPSTQLKSFYYTLFNNLIATKSRNASEVFSYQLSVVREEIVRYPFLLSDNCGVVGEPLHRLKYLIKREFDLNILRLLKVRSRHSMRVSKTDTVKMTGLLYPKMTGLWAC